MRGMMWYGERYRLTVRYKMVIGMRLYDGTGPLMDNIWVQVISEAIIYGERRGMHMAKAKLCLTR